MIPPEKGVVEVKINLENVKVYQKGVDRFMVVIPKKCTTNNVRLPLTSNQDGIVLDSKSFAERYAVEIELDIKRNKGKVNPRNYKTRNARDFKFDGFSEMWLRSKAGTTLGTKRNYKAYLKLIMPYMEKKDLRYVDEFDVEEFMLFLNEQEEWSPSYKQSIRDVYNGILLYAKRLHRLNVPTVPSIKVPTKAKTILSTGQINLLMSRTGKDFEIWRTLFNTGIRQGEAFALRFPNIDIEKKIIYVRENIYWGVRGVPKGKNERKVRMDIFEDLSGMFDRLYKEAEDKKGSVFLRKGKLYDANKLIRSWKPMREGITDLTIHDATRATFICRCLNAGMNHRTVMALVGHQNYETLQKYLDEVDVENIELERVMGG